MIKILHLWIVEAFVLMLWAGSVFFIVRGVLVLGERDYVACVIECGLSILCFQFGKELACLLLAREDSQ